MPNFIFRRDLFNVIVLDNPGGVFRTSVSPSVQMSVRRISMPISFKVESDSDSEEFRCTFSSVEPWRVTSIRVRVYLGVSVSIFHHAIRGPWDWTTQAFLNGNPFGRYVQIEIILDGDIILFLITMYFSDGCLKVCDMKQIGLTSNDSGIVAHFPKPVGLDLGTAPRTRFPVVVCTMPSDQDLDSGDNSGDIGAIFHVVHVRDSAVQLESQIMSTHLKHRSGDVTILQQFYVSEDGGEGRANGDEDDGGGGGGNVCVVCQESPVTRAMLPCRHACTCRKCFVRLMDRCPMCRAQVTSFILIGEEEAETPPPTPRREPVGIRARLRVYWQRWRTLQAALEEMD